MSIAGNGQPIRLVISDVDGTLVTKEKVVTPATVAAVQRLKDAGILFSITSSRPPLGVKSLIEALALSEPVAPFNGGMLTTPDLVILEQKLLAPEMAKLAIETITAHGVDAWLYTDFEWLVRDPGAPHVAREEHTVSFHPKVVPDFDAYLGSAGKVVGVSDDREAMARCEAAVQQACGEHAAASCSQPYYLDVTHPTANKGEAVLALARLLGIPPAQIATIGDGPNDVVMFAQSGMSIAMGNARPDVQQCAHCVTASNEEDGFAGAVDEFILRSQAAVYRRAS